MTDFADSGCQPQHVTGRNVYVCVNEVVKQCIAISPSVGIISGKWTLREQLGRGGYGEVSFRGVSLKQI